MNWKDRFNDPNTKPQNTLPFDGVRLSEDRKSVTLLRGKNPSAIVAVEDFLKFLDDLETDGLNFDREGFMKLLNLEGKNENVEHAIEPNPT